MNLLSIHNLSVHYIGSQGTTKAVDDVSLNLKEGELLGIVGQSGCGKTTLLRLVAGFDHPTQGAILLDGYDISPLPPHQRPVNTVFQNYLT